METKQILQNTREKHVEDLIWRRSTQMKLASNADIFSNFHFISAGLGSRPVWMTSAEQDSHIQCFVFKSRSRGTKVCRLLGLVGSQQNIFSAFYHCGPYYLTEGVVWWWASLALLNFWVLLGKKLMVKVSDFGSDCLLTSRRHVPADCALLWKDFQPSVIRTH